MAQRLDVLEEKFLKTVKENNLIQENDVIVVGVSGGPDSIALLHCLNKFKDKLNYKLICAHINHLIREDSTDDEQFVENLWTEETGREVRYNFFDEVYIKEHANKIAIAHNKNDNAETMLLNLIRGTGMAGLEGIQPIEYGKYIRPFIDISRKEIEDYCEKNKLNPRIDSTNKENIYNRNIIRNEILPIIKKINPNIEESLSRTSKIVRQENEYVNQNAQNVYNSISSSSVGNISFELKDFNSQPITIREHLALNSINELVGSTRNIEKANIDDIVKLAENNVGNKYMELNKKIKIYIKNKKIFFTII